VIDLEQYPWREAVYDADFLQHFAPGVFQLLPDFFYLRIVDSGENDSPLSPEIVNERLVQATQLRKRLQEVKSMMSKVSTCKNL